MRRMATSSHLIVVLSLLSASSIAFYDVGDVTIPTTTAYVRTIPHHLSPTDYELWTQPKPSMITAIAPSMALMGQNYAGVEYSIHFANRAAPHHKQGHGIFKRGVFANDPPLSTCQSCDSNGRPIATPTTSYSATNSTSIPCSTIPYSVCALLTHN